MGDVELSVVIPAYNEESALDCTTREISAYLTERGLSYEIIIVNDGSLDSTLSVAESLASELSSVRILSYMPNHGKGYAVRTGMLDAKGEKILFTDADHATPIEELPPFLDALNNGFDVAVASRAITGAIRTIHQPFYREIGGKVLNLIIQLFAVSGIKDTQCGFKIFSRKAAQSIFSQCFVNRFSFDVEVLFLAKKFGYRIAELPVHWSHHGNSRVNPLKDGLKMLADIAKVRLHHYGTKEGIETK